MYKFYWFSTEADLHQFYDQSVAFIKLYPTEIRKFKLLFPSTNVVDKKSIQKVKELNFS